MNKIKKLLRKLKAKLAIKITAFAMAIVMVVYFCTGCTAIIGGGIAGGLGAAGAIPLSVGWLFFYDGNAGNEELDLSQAILNFGSNVTEIGKLFLSEIVDKKEIKVFGITITIPYVKVEKIFDPTVFSLDPIKMCAIYGAKIMSENPNMTEDDLRVRVENLTDAELEKFLFNKDNPDAAYLQERAVQSLPTVAR
jgi:hypothetical protein